MVVLKRLGVLSVAQIEMIIMIIMGLFFGIFYAIFPSVMIPELDSLEMPFGAGLGWLAIIVFPIIYGILGFVTGAIGALIYNLSAKWIGGIELELVK